MDHMTSAPALTTLYCLDITLIENPFLTAHKTDPHKETMQG